MNNAKKYNDIEVKSRCRIKTSIQAPITQVITRKLQIGISTSPKAVNHMFKTPTNFIKKTENTCNNWIDYFILQEPANCKSNKNSERETENKQFYKNGVKTMNSPIELKDSSNFIKGIRKSYSPFKSSLSTYAAYNNLIPHRKLESAQNLSRNLPLKFVSNIYRLQTCLQKSRLNNEEKRKSVFIKNKLGLISNKTRKQLPLSITKEFIKSSKDMKFIPKFFNTCIIKIKSNTEKFQTRPYTSIYNKKFKKDNIVFNNSSIRKRLNYTVS